MNNTPFKKRSDPFATPTPKVENVVEEVRKEIPVVQTTQQVAPEPKIVEKNTTTRVVVKEVVDANREKYTATMEKSLRRRIKVASAMTGIQVSTFIEQACLEKLEREGR